MSEEEKSVLEDKPLNTNEIVEMEVSEETLYDMQVVEDDRKKKKKNKKESKWRNLSKRTKIIIICSLIGIVVLIIVILLVYIFVFKEDEKTPIVKKPEVIVEKDNYRYENGTLIFLDENDSELGSYECQNKDEDKCFVANYNNEEDDFDITEKIYQDYSKVTSVSQIINNNYVAIYDNKERNSGLIKIYDIEKKEELGKYKLIKKVDNDKVILQNEEDKYGVISFVEEELKEIIEFKYDYLGFIEGKESIVAKNGENWLLIGIDGVEKSKGIVGEIKNFDNKYISVYDESYSLYDYEGKVLKNEKIDYITFDSDYVFVVSNRRMYMYDQELNPYTMDGVRLDNTNYKTTIIFDKDGVEVDRKESFVLNVNEDNIEIETGGEIEYINIYEGLLSAKYPKVSYFDGKLYFYKDDAKTEEIGTYKCNNINIVDENSTEFSNCFVAKESSMLNRGTDATNIGYAPIFNERFVFIDDKVAESNINLWDFQTSKTLVTYKKVDMGYYNNAAVINYVSTAGTLVMAENTSGEYGIVRIENSAVKPFISFDNTESIKYLESNILVKRKDGYVLYTNTGNELAKSTLEIIEYHEKALKVMNNKKYDVNNKDGKIMASGFDYVDFYDNYFVGIQGSKINIYKYEENAKGLISETIEISGTDYENSYTIENNILIVTGLEQTFPFSLEGE
ncbi:MAG: hypothetical protein E7172_03625 [Firmicutes bacterium]|nr:hypothetical protein [Bacillota bacterium]